MTHQEKVWAQKCNAPSWSGTAASHAFHVHSLLFLQYSRRSGLYNPKKHTAIYWLEGLHCVEGKERGKERQVRGRPEETLVPFPRDTQMYFSHSECIQHILDTTAQIIITTLERYRDLKQLILKNTRRHPYTWGNENQKAQQLATLYVHASPPHQEKKNVKKKPKTAMAILHTCTHTEGHKSYERDT